MLEELAGSSPVTVQVPYNQLYQQPLAMSGNVFTVKVPFSWQGFQAPTALPTVVGAITMTRVNSTGQSVQNANLSTSGALSFTLGNDGVSGHANVPVILDTSQFAAGDVILIYVTVSQAFELPSGVTTGSISPSCQMLALNVANQSYNLVAQATSDGTVTAAAVTLKWWNFRAHRTWQHR